MKSESIFDAGAQLLVGLLRTLGLVSAAALLVFPAYKGVFSGYLPVAAGAAILIVCARPRSLAWKGWAGFRRWLAGLPEATYLLLLLSALAAVQTGLILVLRPEPWSDARFVYDQAKVLAETGVMSPFTYYAPAQTWWYALFFRLFGASPVVAQLSHVPLAMATVLVMYALARSVLSREKSRMAALLLGIYPSFVGYVLVTPYYFYLYTLAITGSALAWLRSVRGDTWGASALLGGITAGLGALTKAVLLVAPAQFLVFIVLAFRRLLAKTVLLKWLVFLAGFAIVLAPWIVRNTRVFGEPVLVCASGGLVLYSANNPESNGLYSPLPDEVEVDSPQGLLAHSRLCSTKAREFIREHPAAFLRLVLLKLLHTWGNETTFAELINLRGRALRSMDLAWSFIFQTGWAALVFAWARRALRNGSGARPPMLDILVAVVVLSHALVYCVYEGGARHHLPMVPLLILYVLGGDADRESGTQESRNGGSREASAW